MFENDRIFWIYIGVVVTAGFIVRRFTYRGRMPILKIYLPAVLLIFVLELLAARPKDAFEWCLLLLASAGLGVPGAALVLIECPHLTPWYPWSSWWEAQRWE